MGGTTLLPCTNWNHSRLKKGTLALETQQSSDTTYRLYGYDRLGDDGMPRLLHLKQSIDVSIIPHVETNLNYETRKVG